MGAPDVLARLSALGVLLTREGEAIRATPRSALTDEARALIQAHKTEILAALPDQRQNVPPPASTIAPDERGAVTAGVMTPEAEARRQRVLTMLAERPGTRYAVAVDNPDTDPVILALAIRDKGTCELHIPREKFDPFLVLDLIERHCGTVH